MATKHLWPTPKLPRAVGISLGLWGSGSQGNLIDGFPLGCGQDCCQISELHPFPHWRAGGRSPHQKPHYKVLLGIADFSLWMPRSMDYPPDNKDMSLYLRHPRHFPEVPVWLRAVTFQSNIFLICSRTLCGVIKVSLQQTCYYSARKLN